MLYYMTLFKYYVLFFYFRFKYMSDLVQTPQRTNQAAFDSPFIKRDIKFVNPNIRYSVGGYNGWKKAL